MCGENLQGGILIDTPEGSPPRVRGKRFVASGGSEAKGITPACAGKTSREIMFWIPVKDHPRVCGENRIFSICKKFSTGSPPRVRGKQQKMQINFYSRRITPACAGKTLNPATSPPTCEHHPRVCGENALYAQQIEKVSGSPPRVRGKPSNIINRLLYTEDHPRVCGENCPCFFQIINRLGSPPRVRGKHDLQAYKRYLQRITPACAGKTNCSDVSLSPC